MRGHDDRQAVRAQIVEQVKGLVTRPPVQPPGGLVGKQQRRTGVASGTSVSGWEGSAEPKLSSPTLHDVRLDTRLQNSLRSDGVETGADIVNVNTEDLM